MLTEQQKKECEVIIAHMKANNNQGNLGKLSELISKDKRVTQSAYVHLNYLENHIKLICLVSPESRIFGHFTLTEEGKIFTTFEYYERSKEEEKEQESTLKKLDIELKKGSLKKLKWDKWAVRIAAGSLLVALGAFIWNMWTNSRVSDLISRMNQIDTTILRVGQRVDTAQSEIHKMQSAFPPSQLRKQKPDTTGADSIK